jgi:gamma-glutamyltranspeptidase
MRTNDINKASLWSLIFVLFISTQLGAAQSPGSAAIATAHPLATAAGHELLRAGGNAFDAAVGVSAVLALVDTLESIARHGADGFYKGEIAQRLVDGVRAAGGIWSLQDLADYRVVERQPVSGRYRGLTITSAPPPSSGGVALMTMRRTPLPGVNACYPA